MSWLLIAVAMWALLSVSLGLLVSGMIRLDDEASGHAAPGHRPRRHAGSADEISARLSRRSRSPV